jgi:hypothetical protein
MGLGTALRLGLGMDEIAHLLFHSSHFQERGGGGVMMRRHPRSRLCLGRGSPKSSLPTSTPTVSKLAAVVAEAKAAEEAAAAAAVSPSPSYCKYLYVCP